jgi:hypothetical protein
MARSSTSFQPGNTAAKTHGARSQKTGTDTGSIRAQTLEEYPQLASQPELLERLVNARGHVQELRCYLERVGLLDGRGRPRKALELLRAREKDVKDCVKLIEAGIPVALDGIAQWQIAEWRLRAKHSESRAAAVAWLTAHGLPIPEYVAPETNPDAPYVHPPWVLSPPTADQRRRMALTPAQHSKGD